MPWRGVADDVQCSEEVKTLWVAWYIPWRGVAENVQCPRVVPFSHELEFEVESVTIVVLLDLGVGTCVCRIVRF